MEKCKFCGDSSCHTVTIVIDKEPFDKKVILDVCPSCSIFIDTFGIVTQKMVEENTISCFFDGKSLA